MGEITEAIPTPMPPIIREMTSNENEGAKAHPTPDKRNMKPDRIITFFRPMRSLKKPDIITPMMQPSKPLLTNHPSSEAVKLNWVFTKPIVPEMTAVSKPNSNPPIAAVKQMYTMLCDVVACLIQQVFCFSPTNY